MGTCWCVCVCVCVCQLHKGEGRRCACFPLPTVQVIQLGMMSFRKAGKQRRVLKRALSETYLNLILLQNFQQLNHTGFRKILKKHDKLAHSSRGKATFETHVCRSYFWTSKEVTGMIGLVEKSMIQLEDGNRSKAMDRLRVPPLGTEHRRSHWASYSAGLFSGVLLLSIAVVCVAFSQWPGERYADPHLEPSLRAMRAGLVLCIWFYGFAVNTFGWRRAGVNNVLIFEFDPRNYLNFVELFAVGDSSALLQCRCMYVLIAKVHVFCAVVAICAGHLSIWRHVCTYPHSHPGCWHDLSHLDSWSVPDSLLSLAAHPSLRGTSGDVWCSGLCSLSPTAHPQTLLQNLATKEVGKYLQ